MAISSINKRSIVIAITLILFIDVFASALYVGAKIILEDTLRESLVNTVKSSSKLFDIAGIRGVSAIMAPGTIKEIFLLDEDDNIIFSTDPQVMINSPRIILKIDENEIHAARSGKPAAGLPYKAGNEYFLRAYSSVGAPGIIMGISASAPSFNSIETLTRIFWSWIILSVLLTAIVVIYYRRAVREVEAERIRAERGERFEALSRMAATVAHEIRNPLNIISATLELRMRKLTKNNGEEQEMIVNLKEEVDRLERVVQDFLDLSQEKELNIETVDANEIVELIVCREEKRLSHKSDVIPSIRCILNHHTGTFEADKDRIIQMLSNVLRNSSEAVESNGMIEIKTEGDNNNVLFTIEDSGKGISEDERTKIFEPFLTTKKTGSGLGLAVVKSVVDAHKGSIELGESYLGGAKFVIKIPRKQKCE